ncbi:MAG TPA: metal-dependent hydrolase [Bdellovibrionota bacterium]|nr:metal-dependent hydrolase [Bdellovibrionota bacterium]
MLIFGHLGVGSKLVSPWTRQLPLRAVLLGTLLPDLIDKPLYFGMALATGRTSSEIGLVSCSRTFGHTAIFMTLIALAALARRSKVLAAVALGVASHLFLDNLSDRFQANSTGSALIAMLWPFLDTRFAEMPVHSLDDYAERAFTPFLVGGEIAGLGILSWDLWKRRYESEIIAFFKERRQMLKRFRRSRRQKRQD